MKAAFLTLGCKVNFYETEKMMADFQDHGIDIVEFGQAADICIINTCTVTNIADRKSRQMLHRAKKKNPQSIVAAVGCYVESGREELQKDPSVDVAFSNRDKGSIAVKVLEYMKSRGVPVESSVPEADCGGQRGPVRDRRRKYIKIQDGCNQFCSYCMIPYVRGGGVLSSREEEDILKEIRLVAEEGYKEVVLTGIHLSSYGVDHSEEKQFVALKGRPLVALLQKIDEIQGIERIRLGSLEPRIICTEFMEGLMTVTKLCPHFHLSLQSGCDATLKRMNRHYTAAVYKEKCEMLRRYFEHPAITTDVIAGFPGETEAEFERTREFVKEIGFADVHVFSYSVRGGTKAAGMKDQVPPEVKHRRSEMLMADARQGKMKFEEWFIGREEKILFEEIRSIDGKEYLTGHNERYVMVKIPRVEAETAGFMENGIGSIRIQKTNLI
ncbi:MAG: tRNA (N(6)-L-threonylcarbamoyladenosine(37)-C(2))-methylthiotransferase MtaB [Eubacterium sp.]|nr:tRNA (N(6)-L-threonylcarbamoyladenosine(37)-C(2))-methylthiotransferase MtaB [Eubacterium sp.]